MNRTDRMLAIVLELQGRRWQRAEDLARTFEISKRTIYRDIQALDQAGVPLISTPGRGYSLMEGYFLPPLTFTTDEATMLLLGTGVMAQSFDAEYRAAALAAARKINGVLPDRLRGQVEVLRERIHFGFDGAALRPDLAAKIALLRGAILDRSRLRFRYHSRHHSGASDTTRLPHTREADPYALTSLGGIWYLSAYCHLRQEIRNFRLDRMEDLSALDQTFERPQNVQAHGRDLFEPGSFDIRIIFDVEVARWVQESPSYFTVAQQETTEGLLVTLHVRHEDEILQWLLGWGRHFTVLEPETKRQRVAAEAEALLRSHLPVGALT